MSNSKIKKVLKKILLEDKPKEYCSNYDGKFSMSVYYKNCRITISHNPITETKKVKSWFCSRDVEVVTGKSRTHIHIHPNDANIDSSCFRFENDEILPYLKKYVERYEKRESNKKEKFLNSLCNEQ